MTVGVADTGLDFTHAELAAADHRRRRLHRQREPEHLPGVLRHRPTRSWRRGVRRPAHHRLERPRLVDRRQHRRRAQRRRGERDRSEGSGLVALKISGWCGSAYDSTILDAFTYAADRGIDIVSLSFGGYTGPQRPRAGGHLPALRQGRAVRQAAGAPRSWPQRATSTCGSAPAARSSATVRSRSPGPSSSTTSGSTRRPGASPAWSTWPPRATSPTGPSPTCAPGHAAGRQRELQAQVGRAPALRGRQSGPAGLLQQLRPADRHRGARRGTASSTCRDGTGWRHTGLPGQHGRRLQRLADVQRHVELGPPDPVLRLHGRRVPAEPVLQHHPGHVDGDAARLGHPGADRQCSSRSGRRTRTELVVRMLTDRSVREQQQDAAAVGDRPVAG